MLHAMTREGKDPSVLDLDPNKSMKSQTGPKVEKDDAPALKDDPEYAKYFKMLRMMPKEQVLHAMTREGKDPSVLDLDPNKSMESQTGGPTVEDDAPALKDDPEYAKYFKMLKCGLPLDAVRNALTRDGKEPSVVDLNPEKSLKSQQQNADNPVAGPALKDDPEFAKYFKMMKCGLPIEAVKNALSRDGKDPQIMDLDPEKSLGAQRPGSSERDTGVPLKDDPEYQKYFRMLRMGLPLDAVKNALSRDEKDPAIMDLDSSKSLAFQTKRNSLSSAASVKKKKPIRRKKVYWNPIDPTKLNEDSMWNMVRGAVTMGKLEYDAKEFEELFTESADVSKRTQKKEPAKVSKKLVQVIDPKRSMNGGIVLARLKTDYAKLAESVNRM